MFKKFIYATLPLALAISPAAAFEPTPDASSLNMAFEGESYSPYAGRSFPTFPLWGDTHLHTSTSFDAGAFGTRLDARMAYRFAKGEDCLLYTSPSPRDSYADLE